jgi:hypothetical protein
MSKSGTRLTWMIAANLLQRVRAYAVKPNEQRTVDGDEQRALDAYERYAGDVDDSCQCLATRTRVGQQCE